MAAVVMGLVALGLLGVVVWQVREAAQAMARYHEQLDDMRTGYEWQISALKAGHGRAQEPARDPLVAEMLDRLLDAALPKREEPRDAREEPPGSPGEYEPPIEPVRDWTDPFFGIERSLVGGLAPGQGIPGIGADAPDMEQAGHNLIDAMASTWPDADPADGYERLADHPMANGLLPTDGELTDDRVDYANDWLAAQPAMEDTDG